MSDAWRIVIRRTGGPEVLEREDIARDEPGPGEVRVRNTAIGVNFIDTYHRSGLYPVTLPSGLGLEAAGVIEAVGPGVADAQAGARVAYLAQKPGAYATHMLVPADRLIRLADTVSDEIAAAALLKGVTCWMLADCIARAGPNSAILVHAAAGGVGSMLVQWLKTRGATVIAHAGTAEKAAKAKALGADHALSCAFADLASEVRALTGGRGVDVVIDGVGADSWTASLQALAKRGLMISYGNASGPAPPMTALDLQRGGSLFLTRPTMFDYVDTRADRDAAAAALLTMLASGSVAVEIGQRFALADAAQAHRALEGRRTIGSTVLLP